MSCPYPLALLEYYPSETNSPNISSKQTEAECETPKTVFFFGGVGGGCGVKKRFGLEGFKGID